MNEQEYIQSGTTPLYWDCECEENYIHPKTETSCPICRTVASDQPDSLVDEVVDYLQDQIDLLFDQLDAGHGDVFDTYKLAGAIAYQIRLVENYNESTDV